MHIYIYGHGQLRADSIIRERETTRVSQCHSFTFHTREREREREREMRHAMMIVVVLVVVLMNNRQLIASAKQVTISNVVPRTDNTGTIMVR